MDDLFASDTYWIASDLATSIKQEIDDLFASDTNWIASDLATIIKQEIDAEILCSALVEGCGWYNCNIVHDYYEAAKKWCAINIKHEWKCSSHRFVFENQSDYNWFTLRWVSPTADNVRLS